MFPVSKFLIYCFVTAYTPGPNNLLSMNYAARWGSDAVPFQSWDRHGLSDRDDRLHAVQLHALYPAASREDRHADPRRGLYAVPGLEGLEKRLRPGNERRERGQFPLRDGPAVHESEDLHLRHHGHVPLYPAGL